MNYIIRNLSSGSFNKFCLVLMQYLKKDKYFFRLSFYDNVRFDFNLGIDLNFIFYLFPVFMKNFMLSGLKQLSYKFFFKLVYFFKYKLKENGLLSLLKFFIILRPLIGYKYIYFSAKRKPFRRKWAFSLN